MAGVGFWAISYMGIGRRGSLAKVIKSLMIFLSEVVAWEWAYAQSVKREVRMTVPFPYG
jgi:hypothetical protein